jgi:hypothetical protein
MKRNGRARACGATNPPIPESRPKLRMPEFARLTHVIPEVRGLIAQYMKESWDREAGYLRQFQALCASTRMNVRRINDLLNVPLVTEIPRRSNVAFVPNRKVALLPRSSFLDPMHSDGNTCGNYYWVFRGIVTAHSGPS